MRLAEISIEGFRGFAERQRVDLSSDVLIVVGPNGTGKTSIFDAILWALTGNLKRIGDKQDRITSMYAPAGLARVALTLKAGDSIVQVIRTKIEDRVDLRVTIGREDFVADSAQRELVKAIWEPGLSSDSPADALHTALTRSVYLQQDLVREFIEVDSNAERFLAVSELVGVGRVSDFQRRLEASRNAWAKALKQRETSVEELRNRIGLHSAELARLTSDGPGNEFNKLWDSWWSNLRSKSLGVSPIPSFDSPISSEVLERMLKALQALRGTFQRQLSLFPEITFDCQLVRQSDGAATVVLSELTSRMSVLIKERDNLQAEIVASQRVDEEARVELLKNKSSEDELRSLAALAIRHLSHTCPVCDQTIVPRITKERLQEIIDRPQGDVPAVAFSDATNRLQVDLSRLQGSIHSLSREIDSIQDGLNKLSGKKARLESQLQDLGLSADALPEDLRGFESDTRTKLADLQEAYKAGEGLALSIVRIAEATKRDDLQRRTSELQATLSEAEATCVLYKRTHQAASDILEALRSLASEAVNAQLERLMPILEKIYSRIDPHPTFRSANLNAHFSYGKGRIETAVVDSEGGLIIESPADFFSSSQTNALAVSIFLAMNLSTEHLPLKAAILDDPLQSLDDINLLGLIDVLRRTRSQRQLIISTHDERFANLLERKFRPVQDGETTSRIGLENWDRGGTKLLQNQSAYVPVRLQVVS